MKKRIIRWIKYDAIIEITLVLFLYVLFGLETEFYKFIMFVWAMNVYVIMPIFIIILVLDVERMHEKVKMRYEKI